MIKLHTNHGVISLELDAAKAPDTAANFIQYVKDGHYNNTVFHRVIDGFMVQGGGFEPGMKQKPVGTPIKNEASKALSNKTGTIAMARTSDPHSATCYAHVGQHGTLDRGYAASCRLATDVEAAPLLAELRGIYERNEDLEAVRLVVVKRWTRHHDEARIKSLSRSRP